MIAQYRKIMAGSIAVLWACAGPAALAQSSSCAPRTSVSVAHAGETSYKMEISATNTCSYRIFFRACSEDKGNCKSGTIAPGSTKSFTVNTSLPDGKANFNWRRD